eukprot:gene21205-14103_t
MMGDVSAQLVKMAALAQAEAGAAPPRGPAPRHSHTAVQHSSRSGPGEIIDENGMFVLGGTLVKEAVSGEFWLFDLAQICGACSFAK